MSELFDDVDRPEQTADSSRPNPSSPLPTPKLTRRYNAIMATVVATLEFLTYPARLWLGVTVFEPSAMTLWLTTITLGLGVFLILEIARYVISQ